MQEMTAIVFTPCELGVCTDVDREIVGIPDYEMSVEQVYTRLAVNFIRYHQSLDIICFSAMFTKTDTRGALTVERRLPSWVPDWRRWTDHASRPVPSMVSEPSRQHIGNFRSLERHHGLVDETLTYAASANSPAEYTVPCAGQLACKGFLIDIVDGLGPDGVSCLDGPNDIDLDAWSNSFPVPTTSEVNTRPRRTSTSRDYSAASSDVLESLIRSISLDRTGRYLMARPDLRLYTRQFQNMLEDRTMLGYTYRYCDAVEQWYHANKYICVQGASISEHLGTAAPPEVEDEYLFEGSFWEAAELTTGERRWNCRLVVTERGYLGMVPSASRKGDVIVVLVGCSVPVVLRKVEDSGPEEYTVVGECFMPRFMNGEALESGREKHDFVLV